MTENLPDFSRFFFCLQRPGCVGKSGETFFNGEAFATEYGDEAADAYAQYCQFSEHPPKTLRDRRRLRRAESTIRRVVGVEPSQISAVGEGSKT